MYITKVQRILCENDGTGVDPSLSGNWALVDESEVLLFVIETYGGLAIRVKRAVAHVGLDTGLAAEADGNITLIKS